MSVGLWGRLNLRWQAAIAILIPSVAIAAFSSLYFPARLNAQAEASLESKARAIGGLAAEEIAPALGLIESGLSPEEFDTVLSGIRRSDDVPFAAVVDLHAAPRLLRSEGVQPPGLSLEVANAGCEVENGSEILVRCRAERGESKGGIIAVFKKDALYDAQRKNRQVGFISGAAAATLGLLLAFFFSAALATPVAQVTQAARVVASGDVTVSAVQVSAAGEIRSMANSFNEMLANLRNLVGQMVSLTGRLNNASQGLIGASQDQEHVTNQQAAYAQEIAATFEELSRTAEQISASTDVVETAARRTNEAVEEARQVVAQVVAGIQDIRTESKEVADAILRLNSDLQQVSKIAQVINAVAERSDLLALNAALEGTKAGEIGRGFSLVAAEMRKLAENVSGSARDIGRIVEKVQESGNEAVSKARVGVTASDKGVKVAEQVSELFQRIVELARGTTEAAQQISIATRQQRQSSEQAVQGARNVADLVKQGVDATGRTHKIAQDLQSVAQALASVTGRFKVVRS